MASPRSKPTNRRSSSKSAAARRPNTHARSDRSEASKPPAKGARRSKAEAANEEASPSRKSKSRSSQAPRDKANSPKTRRSRDASSQGASPARTGAAAPPSPRRAPQPRLSPRRAQTLLHLEDALGKRIVGKAEAVEKIARVIRIRQSQLSLRPERPDGSFLLLGPPGVGKNEIAYAVSEILYGNDNPVVSVDLGEIDDEEDLAKLGVTPIAGLEGHCLEGMLTSPVRENPQAVVLLRGLERAHPSLQRLLHQVLERGRIEDMLGPVDFSRTVIFVTMHLAREDLAPSEIGFGKPSRSAEQQQRTQLERYLSTDLLDSFNEVIELSPLTAPEVRQIARYKVDQVLVRMQRSRKEIRVADAVYDELIPENSCVNGSAKFLNRTLEERLFNPLARYLLSNQRSRNIDVAVQRGQIIIRASAGRNGS